MLIDKFVYTDLWLVRCQAYMVIHDWIRFGMFSRINFNIESDAIDRLNELVTENMPIFRNEDQFGLLVDFAIGIPDYRDMLEKVDPSYRSFTGDKGYFVFSYTKLLLRDMLHAYYEEFRALWRKRKSTHNEYEREQADLYCIIGLKKQIYKWICDWIIDTDIDDITRYQDISVIDRLDGIIGSNMERYMDSIDFMQLMRIADGYLSFQYPSSYTFPSIESKEDMVEVMKKIWVTLFRDVFIENFAEFRGMMALRRRINERV